MDTYPGTDFLIRLCYGCGKEICDINDGWADSDESEVVCTECKEKADREYPFPQSHFFPMKDLV